MQSDAGLSCFNALHRPQMTEPCTHVPIHLSTCPVMLDEDRWPPDGRNCLRQADRPTPHCDGSSDLPTTGVVFGSAGTSRGRFAPPLSGGGRSAGMRVGFGSKITAPRRAIDGELAPHTDLQGTRYPFARRNLALRYLSSQTTARGPEKCALIWSTKSRVLLGRCFAAGMR